MTPKRFLIFSIFAELFLLLLAWIVIFFTKSQFYFSVNFDLIIKGLIAIPPMIAFNFGVFFILAKNKKSTKYKEFLFDAVIPLCDNFTLFTAFIISCFAGVCEEYFFRAALFLGLSKYIGLLLSAIISSILFSYIHFLNKFWHFFSISLFYCMFGLYFCAITLIYKSLVPAIVCHAMYNFIVIIFIKIFKVKIIENFNFCE